MCRFVRFLFVGGLNTLSGNFHAKHSEEFRSTQDFELDPGAFERLGRAVSDLPPDEIRELLWDRQAAVGDRHGTVRFESQLSVWSAIRPTGEIEVECVALGEVLAGLDPTYIKTDVEGAELDALRGARRTIATKTPVLAICSCHIKEHLWEVPLLISSLSDAYAHAYAHFLRRYVDEFGELVCYAVAGNRLLVGSRA